MESAIGLIRVSSLQQVETGVSLEMQKQKISDYCRLNDLTLKEIISEEGVSGRASKREGLDRAMDFIASGRAQHLVVYRLDRLSRSLQRALSVVDLLQKHSCQLHSICEKIDTSTATGRFFFSITGAIASWEAETIAERTKSALESKRKQGQRIGKCPYGWTVGADGVNLIEEPTEQKNIRAMLRYRGQGMNLNQIARRMSERGILTRTGRTTWQYEQVKVILNRVG